MDPLATTASECSDEVSISTLLADDDAILALVGLGFFDLGSVSESLLIIYWKL